jgi:hypothetical protein
MRAKKCDCCVELAPGEIIVQLLSNCRPQTWACDERCRRFARTAVVDSRDAGLDLTQPYAEIINVSSVERRGRQTSADLRRLVSIGDGVTQRQIVTLRGVELAPSRYQIALEHEQRQGKQRRVSASFLVLLSETRSGLKTIPVQVLTNYVVVIV